MQSIVQDVLGRIEEAREDIAELALRLGNTYGPVGMERATAEQVHQWYGENGIDSDLVELVEGRANTVGRLRGSGGGRSILFNAHLDTEASGPITKT